MAERHQMVVEEVRRQAEAAKCAKAVNQAQQGQWLKWDSITEKKFTWSVEHGSQQAKFCHQSYV